MLFIWMIIFILTALLVKNSPMKKPTNKIKEVYPKKIGEEVIAIPLLNNYTPPYTKLNQEFSLVLAPLEFGAINQKIQEAVKPRVVKPITMTYTQIYYYG